MLASLRLRDVGPSASMDLELADRLNIFTGDNGLGKTFILEIGWWALTGGWAGLPAWPRRGNGLRPEIEFHLIGKKGPTRTPTVSRFDFIQQEWPRTRGRPVMPGMVIYARVDGGFSVWDPARNYWKNGSPAWEWRPRSFHFSPETLWQGLEEEGQTLCNGLIRDWVSWQSQPKSSPFEVLRRVVESLAPSSDEPIQIGSPVRLSVVDVKDIPSLTMPYGDVPLVHASAGMKRIISLAYLLTWTWSEHLKASALRNQTPTGHCVLLVDEIESHLHPRWQRSVLPSLLRVGEALKAELDFQILATTHAPLVLASAEPYWDEDQDSLFLFELVKGAKEVSLRSLGWAKQGDAVGWLTSPVFGLDQARSTEAENAIEAAEAYMRGDSTKLLKGLRTKDQIHRELVRVLAGQDPFWPRWIVHVKAGKP